MNIPWSKWEAIGVTQITEKPYFKGKYHDLDKEIFFTGGSDEDIAKLLWENASINDLIFMQGNIHYVLETPYGPRRFRFSREQENEVD